MKKCSLLHVVMVSIVLPLLLPPVFAHQPRLVGTETVVHVSLPEISKAYYGSLSGTPVTYHIEAAEPFRLYVNTLVPVMEGIEKDVSATILKQGTVVAHLDASGHDWETFHEPFAGDDYYRGPEYVSMQDAGSYEIQVSSPDNQGKYVLAVGDVEAFPLPELIKTYAVLPRLKSEFFEKSPFSAYNNIMGIFLGGFILIVVGVVVTTYCVIKFIKKRCRAANQE
ncbi:MAG: hypothetical protein ACYSN7_04625 [Planctomycetota bacterium]